VDEFPSRVMYNKGNEMKGNGNNVNENGNVFE
jgi:hypothetical protein